MHVKLNKSDFYGNMRMKNSEELPTASVHILCTLNINDLYLP